MEQPSFSQSVDYLGHTDKLTDTDVISSYKEVCKKLDIYQKKLREECEQKLQRKLGKSVTTVGDISNRLRQRKEAASYAEQKRLIRLKNVLWRRMGPSVGKANKLQKNLVCPSPHQSKDISSEQKSCLVDVDSSSYVPVVPRCNRFLKNLRIKRRIRHERAINPYLDYLNYLRQLPRQNTNNPFATNLFGGINW
ncbi:hypothetical protein RclHR1_04150001 [Rhizophagus clarus]|uniref:Uncharacterized protein n=1 Tax=Rhizophagus clarus TaxID=94130 RepID=A0A2Z6S9Q8_9GLOM|nr:hypothetical protein RclHR1_04150001 [Rhizophagus clarus]GES85627.1 hypothetical protein GLOIN_2v1835733 [Rhizophagus clarus]